jgi:hypothetical protein
MNAGSTHFVTMAYVIGLGLLWGYAAMLWWEAKALARRRSVEKTDGGQS